MKLFGIEWGATRRDVPKGDASAAGKVLAELACLAPRERVKARARMMRAQMGLPPLPALEPRADALPGDASGRDDC
jgi:hypothetical protein